MDDIKTCDLHVNPGVIEFSNKINVMMPKNMNKGNGSWR
jgi:hypothetical protein